VKISKADSISGWMDLPELEWLANAAIDKKNILEIGSWMGRSTRAIADNSVAHITVIDPFIEGYLNGQDISIKFKKNMQEYIDEGRITIIEKMSKDALFDVIEKKFDMIFVDGEHWYEYAHFDIKNYLPLLAKGGLFCGHDYTPNESNFHGLIKAVHELVPDGYYVDIPVGRIWRYIC